MIAGRISRKNSTEHQARNDGQQVYSAKQAGAKYSRQSFDPDRFDQMILYSYWRSTTSFRVRTVLNFLKLDYETRSVNLLAGGQRDAEYTAINPAKGVPALVLDTGAVLTQSWPIIDYLLETNSGHGLLPDDPVDRALVRAAAAVIAFDIHPVNNLRILARLRELRHGEDVIKDWNLHWMTEGFTAFQALIEKDTPFCFGQRPSLADIALAGQMVNARRWGVDMTPFQRLVDIDARCRQIDAFNDALPENQPDAQ